ncbi:MAG: methyltransferase domain-containing protein [Actinobacteria bacterium]|jgi:SAM-dependent methyltransferase|nr:methyltransferase domain-containing protein [Actinomycetota bacterium]
MTPRPDPLTRFYPESAAGGFSRNDGTVAFYQRVQALLRPDSVVIDFGAGRGQFLEDPVPMRRDLQLLRARAAEVIGLDLDPAVLENPALTSAHIIESGSPLPVADESADLVVSDWTFEHVTDPFWLGDELYRVLRPGGWICARTPNKWGATGIGGRIIPNRLHHRALAILQPAKNTADTFPTAYRLNTARALHTVFSVERFSHHSYRDESEPTYAANSTVAWRASMALSAILPNRMASNWLVFLRKKGKSS